MTTLVLTQITWCVDTASDVLSKEIVAARDAAMRRQLEPAPVLVLLPQAHATIAESSLAAVGRVARDAGVWLAGAARIRRGVGAASSVSVQGFLFDATGAQKLLTAKITPELVDGFDDVTSALGTPAPFEVVHTPFGNIGILPGEDVFYCTYARSMVFHGAELILNPAVERSDSLFDSRQGARLARAGEQACFVAVATAADGAVSATALYAPTGMIAGARGDERFVFPDYDLQSLRRSRLNPQKSFPAIVRANTYARGYDRAAAATSVPTRAPTTGAEWRAEAKRRIEAQRLPSKHARHEEQYEALLVQECPRLIPLDRSIDARALMMQNLDESLELAGSRANIPSVRLCIFPEFWLTGPGGIGGVQRTVDDMARLAISQSDPIFERIAKFAQQHKVYVAFQNFEVHSKMPGRVFNSAFLIDDSGNLVHTYRKNQCADVWGLLPDTTPGSVLSRYLDIFGEDALFPIADTPLGRLANMICFDNMVPEVAHGLRRAGAEVIMHSSSEPHGGAGRDIWDICRRTRAFENTCYVLSACDGGEHVRHDSDVYTFFRRGHSRIVRFDGRVEGTVDGPGPVAFRVNIDLAALRRARANPLANLSLWDDPAVYANVYAGDVGLPNDLWAGDPNVNPYAGARQIVRRIDDYLSRGIYLPATEELARRTIPDAI